MLTRDGRAIGVVLADGTELTAPVVVSALDARRTFLDLVDPRELPDDLVDNVRRTRYRGTSAKVNFALDGMPEFPGLPGSAAPFGGFINIGPTLEYLERAYDAAKYGWYSDRPFIDGAMQSVIDPDMAPPGKHVLSCFVQHAPYELKGPDGSGWTGRPSGRTSATRPRPCSRSTSRGSASWCSSARSSRRLDIERVTGLTEGNIFAGEFLAPQMYFFRPAPGWSQYATPIDGYYQCGSGTHPGGCVIGSPGPVRQPADPARPRSGGADPRHRTRPSSHAWNRAAIGLPDDFAAVVARRALVTYAAP